MQNYSQGLPSFQEIKPSTKMLTDKKKQNLKATASEIKTQDTQA
jgi:hypothetical protein